MEASHGEYRHRRAQGEEPDLRSGGNRRGSRGTEDPDGSRAIRSGDGKAAEGASADRGGDGERMLRRGRVARTTDDTQRLLRFVTFRLQLNLISSPPLRHPTVTLRARAPEHPCP